MSLTLKRFLLLSRCRLLQQYMFLLLRALYRNCCYCGPTCPSIWFLACPVCSPSTFFIPSPAYCSCLCSNRPLLNTLASNPFITPEPVPRPSLKRSRSSPTLSPPLSSNTNPNLFAQSLALLNLVISHKTDLNTSYVPPFQLAFPSASQDSSILSEDPPLLS